MKQQTVQIHTTYIHTYIHMLPTQTLHIYIQCMHTLHNT